MSVYSPAGVQFTGSGTAGEATKWTRPEVRRIPAGTCLASLATASLAAAAGRRPPHTYHQYASGWPPRAATTGAVAGLCAVLPNGTTERRGQPVRRRTVAQGDAHVRVVAPGRAGRDQDAAGGQALGERGAVRFGGRQPHVRPVTGGEGHRSAVEG